MTPKLAIRLNALALYAISAMLLFAFYWQFAYGELPARSAYCSGLPSRRWRWGRSSPSAMVPSQAHYGLVIIAALLGAAIAARQILLHIMPGDAGFGSAFLGLHFYTWAFLCFVAAILAAGVMLTFDKAVRAGGESLRRGHVR